MKRDSEESAFSGGPFPRFGLCAEGLVDFFRGQDDRVADGDFLQFSEFS